MSINIDNFWGTNGYDIDLRQKDVGGGKIAIKSWHICFAVCQLFLIMLTLLHMCAILCCES